MLGNAVVRKEAAVKAELSLGGLSSLGCHFKVFSADRLARYFGEMWGDQVNGTAYFPVQSNRHGKPPD